MRVSEIPHADHGRVAVCACQATFCIDDSTVVEEFSLPDLPPPNAIGRWRIVRYIGRGAASCVYEGIHPELGIPAAIKVPLPEYATDKPTCERFLHAAKICAKAVHPNIVKVYETGKDANGVPFLAMEFLSGGTLADRILEKGHFSAKEAAEIGVAVCSALTETEKLGIVHRDIKPDNIMISAKGTFKLTDLGLAKHDAPAAQGNTAHVLAENEQAMMGRKKSFGTLEYMSPEQHIDTETCDIRSDIYSLGITLYQLAAGRLPFEPMTRSELRHMHLSVEPLVPSSYMPEIPIDFDYIVLHSIQKRPEDRYQTPSELLADLEAFLADAPLPSTTCGAVPIVHTPNLLIAPNEKPLHSRLLPVAFALVLLILAAAGALLVKHQLNGRKTKSGTPPPSVEIKEEPSAFPGQLTLEGTPFNNLLKPSSKALDDAGITIVEERTDVQTTSYFEEAKAAAEQAAKDGFGFAAAIEDLESFTSSDEYSDEAKSLIFSLKKASSDAVKELMKKLDEKAAPLIEAREWEGALNVYRTDIGPLATESQMERDRRIREIEARQRFSASGSTYLRQEESPQP